MAKRIIAADDVDFSMMALESTLESICASAGIDIDFEKVEDGAALVQRVLSQKYDLVFTDFNMPFMDGLDAIKRIREEDRKVPIYIVTTDDIERQALDSGATGYINKRHLFDGIKKAVENHLV